MINERTHPLNWGQVNERRLNQAKHRLQRICSDSKKNSQASKMTNHINTKLCLMDSCISIRYITVFFFFVWGSARKRNDEVPPRAVSAGMRHNLSAQIWENGFTENHFPDTRRNVRSEVSDGSEVWLPRIISTTAETEPGLFYIYRGGRWNNSAVSYSYSLLTFLLTFRASHVHENHIWP